jgi:hypothetical protein
VITELFKLLPSGVAGDLFALRDEIISMDASSILYLSNLLSWKNLIALAIHFLIPFAFRPVLVRNWLSSLLSVRRKFYLG